MGFLDIRLLDILDIFLVAVLFYQLYKLMKGTVAIKIFIGLFSFIVLWLVVKALDMELLGTILDNLVSVGVIAIIVLFQEEIRSFFTMIGSRYKFNKWFTLDKILVKNRAGMLKIYVKPIVEACKKFSKSKTGALIIISKSSELVDVAKTGELLNAAISSSLLENIFFKNSPLHDGAVIIANNKIKAAQCILPVSRDMNLPSNLGLRHRAGLGIAQKTDAQVVIVSEENGRISYAHEGKLKYNITVEKLTELLNDE